MRTSHALAALAAALVSSSALAMGPGYLGELDNASIDIGNTLGSKTQPFNGAFADVYTFDLIDPGFVKGGVHTTIGLPFGIKILKVSLSGGTMTGVEEFLMNENSATANFLQEDLGSGHYTLTVSGLVFGGHGSYGGDIAAVTAAVPEPESMALALAGVASVLALSRRRKQR
ncbi:FxDxF family PEP-CTERM protein [Aquabacterium sp.]|uniref:FxDxF family PEP-CTERM protein n=1 Tax=Aquabacterium sp. TaxID=1872578 RepID=UPI002E30DDA9|nr:FxDxF family PEP-CTERM protein [Aquabacterium sp.]HEX5311416.1 FxDxF family PEP-CTERM protein [Aquabacterium sp.]